MLITALGILLVFSYAAINVVNGDADDTERPLPPTLTDLAAAKVVEVKDAGGQVVLSGSFTKSSDVGGELEHTAILNSTGVDADAKGVAETEVSKKNDGFIEQELEVKVEGLAAQAVFTLFIDGQEVASFTTDARGEAELEMSNEASK
jgi:hypothetical protein